MKIKAFHNVWLLRIVHWLSYLSIPIFLLYPETFNLYAFLIGLICITMLGGSGGLHRYFSHKSFSTGKKRHWFLAFVTTLSTQGSIPLWTEMHRLHHAHSDTEDDPIAPSVIGLWRGFFALQDDKHLERMSTKAIVKQLRDPAVLFFHNWYWPTIISYVVVISLIDPSLILTMYLCPVFLIRFMYGVQNTLGHGHPKIGYRNHDTKDNSRNSTILNIITCFLGEALHNNHHANPGKYHYSEKWYEIDPTGRIIKHLFAKS